MRQSDLDWLKKLRSRREKDFNAFFDHFFPRLYRFALARLRDRKLAEEVVQEALCKGILNIDTYLGEAALFSWLCTIVRREISRVLTRENAGAARLLSLEDDTVVAALESLEDLTVGDPQLHYDKLQLADRVRLAMASLPSHYADILEWRYLQGDSVADIASKLNKSYKATESLLSRSREVFRDAFLAVVDAGRVAGNIEER